MSASDEIRATLATRQAALLNALVSGCKPPEGFNSQRVLATAKSLARKRARCAWRAWPRLADAMGKTFDEYFAAYAGASPLPGKGGPLADGHRFARWLSARGLLPEAGRLEAIAVDLRYRRIPAGLVRRRWPMLRVAWLRQSRRVTIAIRLPWFGERWVSV